MTKQADLVITGADVRTMDPARPCAGGVALRGDRIVGVSVNEAGDGSLLELTGPRTERLHLPGRVILPGFQDAHVHPAFAGRNLLRVNLDDVDTRSGVLDRVGRYAREHPDEPWILGGGWSMGLFPGGRPTAAELDEVVPDRPAFLMNRDVHTGWANSRALEVGGITRGTPDPWDGRIERDPASGEPTGALHEGAAYAFWERVVPATTAEAWRAAILVAQRHLHGLGITGWQDAWVRPDLLRAYRDLDDAGELAAQVAASLWWDRNLGLEQIDGFIEQRAWGTGGRVRAETVKIMVDGVAETCTCAMLDPYLGPDGRPTSERGLRYVGDETLRDAAVALDAAGFQIHLHAIGELHRVGARLAMGSDWGVSSPNPLLQIEVAVTRTDPWDRAGRPLLPEQALDPATAFEAFTLGSAFVDHDDDAGAIEAGKRADLVVLDRDPLATDAGPIGGTRVEMTIADGRVVHERS